MMHVEWKKPAKVIEPDCEFSADPMILIPDLIMSLQNLATNHENGSFVLDRFKDIMRKHEGTVFFVFQYSGDYDKQTGKPFDPFFNDYADFAVLHIRALLDDLMALAVQYGFNFTVNLNPVDNY
jgi:hypothetical protein